jgi:hypothetical protein
MTEADWLGGIDPERMLQFLTGRRDRPEDRKLRLFACACVRRLEAHLSDRRCRAALETSEAFADGRALRRQLDSVHRAAQQVAQAAWSLWLGNPDYEAFLRMTQAVVGVTDPLALAAAFQTSQAAADSGGVERRAQSELLREIFGNPVRPVVLAQDWLRWNGRTPLRLAHTIYEERAFEQLPVLADALEEAGCTDEAILRHCRQPGHVRGCWVLDAVLAGAGG